jgi:hypothetical protein
MPGPLFTAEVFRTVWAEEGGSAVAVARRLGMSERAVFARRQRMRREGFDLPGNEDCASPGGSIVRAAYPRQLDVSVSDGLIVAFGDLHSAPLAWRNGDTQPMRMLLEWLAEHGARVRLLLCMGDVLDGASIGRHPPLGWEERPTIEAEIGAGVHDLDRLAALAPDAERLWVVGNHDERFDRTLAQQAKEFRSLTGMRMQDHFQRWRMAWSVRVNDEIVAVHRWHGGVHAAHNNLMKSGGAHMVTGDTHRLDVKVFHGQVGPRYAVETGTLAEPDGTQFAYTRGLMPNWQPGFAVLPIVGGELHRPDTVSVFDAPKPRVRVKAGGA